MGGEIEEGRRGERIWRKGGERRGCEEGGRNMFVFNNIRLIKTKY